MPVKVTRISSRQFVSALAHGLKVLEALAEHGPEMDLGALAQHARLPKPTTWRLVHTLVSLGYVHQEHSTRRFSLSPRILALGVAFESMDLKELAAPYLRELSARVGETVNMAVRDETNLIYIERIKTLQVVNINLHVGSRLPLYNTSMGRVLIAQQPDEWLDEYMASLRSDPAAAPYIAGGGAKLRGILRQVRQRGYAVNDEELTPGLRSVASPIVDGAGRVLAAVNISVPSARMSMRDLRTRKLPELLKTTQAISAAGGLRRRGAMGATAVGDIGGRST